MDAINKNLKTLNRLDWVFIIIGAIEIFGFVFYSQSLYGMVLGIITIIPAYIALKEKKFKLNYFIGIWAIIRYNPIFGIAIMSFILGDFYRKNGFTLQSGESVNNVQMIISITCTLLFMLSTFVLGIILIIKTKKQYKLLKIHESENSIENKNLENIIK